jgi:lysophospholipase L1-like esterase
MSNLLKHIYKLVLLVFAYLTLPIFELRGFYYGLGFILLFFAFYEIRNIFNLLVDKNEKFERIQKKTYPYILLGIVLMIILILPIDSPAGDKRYLRIILILYFIFQLCYLMLQVSKSAVSNVVKNFFLFFVSLVTIISIIEIVFMFVATSHGSGNAYSGKIWMQRYWNPINSLGFRDKEPENKKNTILFVGDSFTAGWGLKNIEDRFDHQAISILAKKERTINGINLGRYGADTKLEFSLTKSFISKSKIHPKKIVLQFFVNDVDKFLINDSSCISKAQSESLLKKIFLDGSYLYNYIYSIYPTSENPIKPKRCDYGEKLKMIYTIDSLWLKEQIQLDKFTSYCKAKNIELTILFFPFMEDLTLSKKINANDRLAEYCKFNKLKFINVYNYLI